MGLALLLGGSALAVKPYDPGAIGRLERETNTKASLSPATGAVRFAKIKKEGWPAGALSASEQRAKAMDFLGVHGRAFGLNNAATELKLVKHEDDSIGSSHLSYEQVYNGIPVFAGTLRVHFDKDGDITAVNGTVIPDINVNTTPRVSENQAASNAINKILSRTGALGLQSSQSRLVIFRLGLDRGIEGNNILAYEVSVSNGADVGYDAYVDGDTGIVVAEYPTVYEALNRRAFDGQSLTLPWPNYPDYPYWTEGDPFPTADVEANNVIVGSGETYGFFLNTFGRDSFDGLGGTMDSIFRSGNSCSGAASNYEITWFCAGWAADDVVPHEWGHAYTAHTSNLKYAFQSGALNESYSDVCETVDLLNAPRGPRDDPAGVMRTGQNCTVTRPGFQSIRINNPPNLPGTSDNYLNSFGRSVSWGPIAYSEMTADVVLADDGVGTLSIPTVPISASRWDACTTLSHTDGNAAQINGKIALVFRGSCGFDVKSKNVQNAGAIGVIIGNQSGGGNGGETIVNMGCSNRNRSRPRICHASVGWHPVLV